MKKNEVELNASRIVDAISRIGYKPSAALMDIVDNSVMADASHIIIELEIEDGEPANKKNNVVSYRVIDNGVGMSEDQLVNSLTLGSEANYGENSLSKYGMGLKSAGFSLGEIIYVITKEKDVDEPLCAFVDKRRIREDEGYFVYQPDREHYPVSAKFYEENEKGTIVEIQDIHTPHEAALTTINNLSEKLGVTYAGFLAREDNPLRITVTYLDKAIEVEPHDMLFKSIAKTDYIADDYDYLSPYLTHKNFKIELEDAPDAEPITVNVSLFPRALMSRYGGFTKEGKDKVASYKVSSKNKGFFIYRNGRLIRWGDTLPDGIGGDLIGRENINLRASIEFETQHDDALHVDVSKQRFDLPAQVSDALKDVLTFPKEYSQEILRLCTEKFNEYESPDEGGSFNERNTELAEEDSLEFTEVVDKDKQKERIKELAKDGEELQKQLDEGDEKKELLDQEIVVPKKVRYSEKMMSQNLWTVGFDAETGAYVVINKNHPYYSAVFKNLGESTPERQSLEALFWSFAAAEKIVRTKLVEFDDEAIKAVVERFKMEVGYNIYHWVRSNVDLFSK